MVSDESRYQSNMDLIESSCSAGINLLMQHVSLHAHRYPRLRATLQNDRNFTMPPTASNSESYMTLSWMSCMDGSFPSHLCDSMANRQYPVTTSVTWSIWQYACFIMNDTSSLYSMV